MAHRRPLGRQAAATASSVSAPSSAIQPSTTVALSTTFTPPTSCIDNSLTILPPPGYFIWANEPVPVEGTTVTDCYPSEFLQEYTSVSSGTVGSSIVPVMSPLVCPQNFCVQFAVNNYMACCPSGYKFAAPHDPVIASRPAYGGTCYSDFSVGVTATAVAYDGGGSTRLQPWAAESSGAQAYAHPIDGLANNKPSVGCVAAVSNASSSASSSTLLETSANSTGVITSSAVSPKSTAALSTQSSRISSGTIAGAVVGALFGLAAIVGLIFLLLRRRRRQPSSAPEICQIDDGATGSRFEKDGAIIATEAEAGVAAAELTARSDKHANRKSALNSGRGAYEMTAETAYEMPTSTDRDPRGTVLNKK